MTTTNTQPQRAIIVPAQSEDEEAVRDSTPTEERRASYLPEQDSQQASQRWQRIQGEFVDDPRKSVGEAHELVGELMQRIVDSFASERRELENQWSKGGDVSTEDLRVCLQRYRAFFSRLLPLGERAS